MKDALDKRGRRELEAESWERIESIRITTPFKKRTPTTFPHASETTQEHGKRAEDDPVFEE
jgi:hypothetical protein